MVQALSADRADQSFDVAVLPRRSRSNRNILDCHGGQALMKDPAIAAMVVADQKSGCMVPRERFGDLPGRPFGRGVCGHTEVDNTSSFVAQHNEVCLAIIVFGEVYNAKISYRSRRRGRF